MAERPPEGTHQGDDDSATTAPPGTAPGTEVSAPGARRKGGIYLYEIYRLEGSPKGMHRRLDFLSLLLSRRNALVLVPPELDV